ncbi:MAG: DUF493 domain-containing protein [Xanthomonadales bacterium]|nr:DUF493 domain-containing protein [Xanthomonadales bacterium]|tara:strand:- start:1950 stop:2225 length:276 start_codon:yes stop_codon:yes gene_type:complete
MNIKLDTEGALEFPCRYPVKAMTHARERALDQVITAIANQGADPDRASVTVRPSRNGRFQSITVEVHAQSRTQLESVYSSLRALDVVVMTL